MKERADRATDKPGGEDGHAVLLGTGAAEILPLPERRAECAQIRSENRQHRAGPAEFHPPAGNAGTDEEQSVLDAIRDFVENVTAFRPPSIATIPSSKLHISRPCTQAAAASIHAHASGQPCAVPHSAAQAIAARPMPVREI